MTRRLIVTDLDRTLLNAAHDVDALTVETFRALEAEGHHLAIASGRHYRDILPIRDKLGVAAHIISSNGAYVHGPDDALVSADPLASWLALDLIAFDRPPGVRLNLYRDDEWLIDAPAPSLLALHEHTGFSYRVADLDALDGHGIGKVLYIGEPELLAALEGQIRSRLGDNLHLTYSLANSLEIMGRGVNKGAAVQRLLDSLGLAPSACIAFGDNLNDTEMLNLAGHAYIMDNAHPELEGRVPRGIRIGRHDEMAVAQRLRDHFGLSP
ncbi:Cof-type HAD-IIB family hydrolase [Litchfieldella xinjiangensis]|uniref:Cof-type HAD-IIB family hydrolase n=1 Tax=Litchfieldella xinjiangensis TaxID=1166948 RepID=UPI0005BCD3F5|nr:Cof-type HAD-IIB family hydrolase [Halomonas xinjiangensis]